MKKQVKYILIVIVLVVITFFFINKFKTHHTIKYHIKNNNNIEIIETYHKDNENDYYILEINKDDKKFIFDVNNKFNKKKKIIKDVIVYDNNDLTCIYPISINDKVTLNIECLIDDKLYSYNSIKDEYDLNEFTENIPNFNSEYYNDKKSNISKYNDIKVYNDNLYDNENIILYNYKELIKIKKHESSKIQFSNFDIYNNTLGVLINNWYLIPKYSNKPEISSYYVIDIVKEKKNEIKIDKKLSTNVYINGIIDDKLYIFDKSNIIQYEIDPKKKKINKVGDKNAIKFYDGKWINSNPYDYVNSEKKFNLVSHDIKLSFEYENIFETSNAYYFYTDKGSFYKVYKKYLENPILLFESSDYHEVKLINNKVYFISNNSIYRYDDYGIKTILQRNELKYNFNNIYSVYFE